jgi:hypothetical protein
MVLFRPAPHHIRIGVLSSSRPDHKTEIDRDLYYDNKKNKCFNVESTEYQSGPDVGCSHEIENLDNDALEALLQSNPEFLEKLQQLRKPHNN